MMFVWVSALSSRHFLWKSFKLVTGGPLVSWGVKLVRFVFRHICDKPRRQL